MQGVEECRGAQGRAFDVGSGRVGGTYEGAEDGGREGMAEVWIFMLVCWLYS